MSYDEERQPLLPGPSYSQDDVHDQFCQLIGCPPSDLPPGRRWRPADRSLYERALKQRSRQNCTYQMTASVANLLLLAQVIIGAAVTGLGATASSHVTITLLGASNTIIAGLVAYLKSRGQPMRARVFRDDLERVVDEIENSEVMWLGISKGVNGYDDIDTDDSVTVRSEVARLTRLYDKAVRNNAMNNPDLYGSGEGGMSSAALRNRSTAGAGQAPAPAAPPGPASAPTTTPDGQGTAAPVTGEPTPVAADPDESPATAKPTLPTAVKVVVSEDDASKTDGAKYTKSRGDDKADDTKDAKKDDDGKSDDAKDAKKDGDGKTDSSTGAPQDRKGPGPIENGHKVADGVHNSATDDDPNAKDSSA